MVSSDFQLGLPFMDMQDEREEEVFSLVQLQENEMKSEEGVNVWPF